MCAQRQADVCDRRLATKLCPVEHYENDWNAFLKWQDIKHNCCGLYCDKGPMQYKLILIQIFALLFNYVFNFDNAVDSYNSAC